MKKLFAVLAALFLLAVMACSGGGGGSSDGSSNSSLTAKEIEGIETSSSSIKDKLSNEIDPGSEEALNAAKSFALTLPNVESADLIEGNLVVKYKEAGYEIWIANTPAPSIPPNDYSVYEWPEKSAELKINDYKSPVGNHNAVLINTTSDDPWFADKEQWVTQMKRALEATDYNVEILTTNEATPDKLANLSQYSVIVFIGHGGFKTKENSTEQVYAMSTGKEWDHGYWQDWVDGIYVKVSPLWGRTHLFEKSFYGITEDFWKKKYRNNHFTRALFINDACNSANSKTESFRNILKDIGVVAYAGWTGLTSISDVTASVIISTMALDKSLQQAFDLLPSNLKHDQNYNSDFWIGYEKSITLTTSSGPNVYPFGSIQGKVVSCSGQSIQNAVIGIDGVGGHSYSDSNGQYHDGVPATSYTNGKYRGNYRATVDMINAKINGVNVTGYKSKYSYNISITFSESCSSQNGGKICGISSNYDFKVCK